ncbi:hypothetical protein [Streptomyces sp. NPDC059881]|uniref:DUF7144 family membrane protein n=1 Tax=Streptomyces sp. NPDC059881 TaxID=3346986 RepID=UPI00364B0911
MTDSTRTTGATGSTGPTGTTTKQAPATGGHGLLAAGLATFAAVILIIAGFLDLFRGIMAIAHDDLFVTTRGYVFRFDLTAWGWLHLIFGVLAIVAGFALFKAALWARILGIVLAGVLVIVNFLSLPYYPLWSLISIALYIAVIWALCVVRPDDF